jgi:outer membrane protein assembly factor BamD (BamD/ComL family)
MNSRRRVNSAVGRLLRPMFLFIIHFCMATVLLPQGNSSAPQRNPPCDPQILSQAESSFRDHRDPTRRPGFKGLERAETDIEHLLQTCPLNRQYLLFERRLRIVREEMAQHNMYLALAVLRMDGVHLLQGALTRLRQVGEEYPHFSRHDYVLYMLADLSERNGSRDDAVKYYRRLISEYPRGIYAKRARKQLFEFQRVGDAQQVVGPERGSRVSQLD